jgi:anti-anti-sigma factor
MKIKEKEIKETTATVLFSGDMTIYHVKKINNDFTNYLKKYKSLIVDLSEINKFDSAGFQLLLFFKKESERLKKKIIYKNHSEVATRVIELYGGVGGD